MWRVDLEEQGRLGGKEQVTSSDGGKEGEGGGKENGSSRKKDDGKQETVTPWPHLKLMVAPGIERLLCREEE